MSVTEAEQPSIPLSAVAEVDRRICPLEDMIDWESPALDPRELAMVNHVHGIVGDFITGPGEVKIAIGVRTLGDLEGFEQAVDAEIAGRNDPRFTFAVSERRGELGQGLATRLSNLFYEDRRDEVVPAIVRQFTGDFEHPEEGPIDDLEAWELGRAVERNAVRDGLVSNLRFALGLHLDSVMTDRRLSGTSPEVTIDVQGSDDEIAGRLRGLHNDLDGGEWLEVQDDNGDRRRIDHGTVRTLGITVAREQITDTQGEEVVEGPTAEQPKRKRLFRS